MKRTFKILGIIAGSVLFLVGAGAFIIYGSNYISASYEVDNPVYGPDKVWHFRADFYDSSGNLLRQDTILLTSYNQRFLFFQNKVTWSLQKGNTLTEETTGVVEDETRLWLHPPRFDGYVEFTEYSAFPEMRPGIETGTTWKMQLTLGTFATEKTGKNLDMAYTIQRIDTLKAVPLNREITILGQGVCGLGTYTNEIIYTDLSGFTKLSYTKDNKEQLIIQLISIGSRI